MTCDFVMVMFWRRGLQIFFEPLSQGHTTAIEKFSIVGREDQNLMRTIKEALYIRVNKPSPNKK